MKIEIEVRKPWPYRHPRRGRQVLQPGYYIAPEQISEDIARRAISEGMAKRIRHPVEELASFAEPTQELKADPVEPKKKRGRPRKAMTYPLENKVLHVAENK